MLGRISTLSTGMQLQRQGAALRLQFEQAGSEMSSGLKRDVLAATHGDSKHLFSLDRAMARIDAQAANLSLAEGRAGTTSKTLALLQKSIDQLGPRLLSAGDREDMSSSRIEAADALNHFDSAIAALNARYAGRSVFAGDAADRAATASAGQILSDLATLTAAATSGTAVAAIVDDYFNNPASGYSVTGYLGSAGDAAPVELAEGESVAVQVRADDPAIREVLRNLALASLVANGTLSSSPEEQREILRSAGGGLLAGQDEILALRANLGHIEQRISDSQAFQEAERTGLEIARNNIVASDPYLAATRFQAMQGQLQSHYLVSSRLSQLSLTSYMG